MKIEVNELKNKVNKISAQSDVFSFVRMEKSFAFNKQGVISFEINESEQTALRLELDNGVGYATASGSFSEDELIRLAVETSKFNTSCYNFNVTEGNIVEVEIYDPQVEKLENNDFIRMSSRLIESIEKYGIDFECRVYTITDQILYIDTEFKERGYIKTMFKISFEGQENKNTETYHYYYRQASCRYFDFVKEIVEAVHKQSKYLPVMTFDGPKTINAILSPFAVYSIFRNYIALSFNAKRVLSEKLELPEYNSGITIYDSGIEDWKIGSQPFDDEGTPCQLTTLMDKGVSKQFYCDSFTSFYLQTQRTGNAKRGWSIPPSPVPNNLIIRCKDVHSDLFRKLGDGIYVDYVINDGKTNTIGGIFSGDALRAFYVSDGIITHKLTNLKILINIIETLDGELLFGDDCEWVAGDFNTPSILVGNLKVF